MFILFILLLYIGKSQECHPECSWACDSPVCPAVCEPVCEAPVCEICDNSTGHICYPQGGCYTRCPSDQCEADSCPVCETLCPHACYDAPACYIQCQETMCSWRCRKPTNCPYPRCELQCEHPACEHSGASSLSMTLLRISVIVPLIVIVL